MSPDLFYLTLTAGLCVVLWIPYIAGLVSVQGMLKAEDYKSLPKPKLPDWVERANRAHINLVESLPSFAALVLVAHVSGTANGTTAVAASMFFWARLAHAVVFFTGLPYVRTLAFAAGTIAQLVIFWQIVS